MKVAQDHKITRVTALPGEGWRRSEAPGMGHRRRQQPRARRGLLKFVGVRAWVVDVAERYGWVWRQRDVDLHGSRGAFSRGPWVFCERFSLSARALSSLPLRTRPCRQMAAGLH
jgi:hypothetical protein